MNQKPQIMLEYIDSSIKLDNNKNNQKLPHIYVITKLLMILLSVDFTLRMASSN